MGDLKINLKTKILHTKNLIKKNHKQTKQKKNNKFQIILMFLVHLK